MLIQFTVECFDWKINGRMLDFALVICVICVVVVDDAVLVDYDVVVAVIDVVVYCCYN